MVSLAFHLFVVGTVSFAFCALLTVVVHSFVADSSLLDYCDLVGLFLFVFVFCCCCCFSPPYACR